MRRLFRLALLAFTASILAFAVAGCSTPEVLPVLSELPDFALVERSGAALDKSTLAGHPVVVDFIFTRCPASCPRLTARMKELEKLLPEGSTTRLLSISVDPEYDRPEVLRRYADGWLAGPRWLFATGDRAAIWGLIRKGFLLPVEEIPPPAESPILHSNRFCLIDGAGRLRSTYEAFDARALDRILADLEGIESAEAAEKSEARR